MTNTGFNYIIIIVGSIFSKCSSGEQIRTRKIFVMRDLFVYASLALLITGLLLFLIFYNPQNTFGFKVELDGKLVLTHVYGQDFSVEKDYGGSVEIQKDGDGYAVKILTETGHNTLFVNETDKTVKMLDSDCPSKNCVHMQAISNAGAIYCAPRELKITPLSDGEFLPPTVGGQG